MIHPVKSNPGAADILVYASNKYHGKIGLPPTGFLTELTNLFRSLQPGIYDVAPIAGSGELGLTEPPLSLAARYGRPSLRA